MTAVKTKGPAVKRLARVAALTLAGFAIATGVSIGDAPIAHADAGRTLSGNVSCRGTEVSGVWVENSAGESGFAHIEHQAQWGGLFSVSWEYAQPTTGSYYLAVGCGSNGGKWVSTVYSDTTNGGQSAWACNDLNPWWGVVTSRFRALTLFDEAIETEVPYGRCQQI